MDDNNTQVTNNDLLDALVKLNESSSATNKSVQELQAYFIAKDKREEQKSQTQEKIEQEADKEASELEQQALKQEQSEKAEQTAKADAQNETYTELLTDIRDQVTLNNQIMSGQLLFIGIICGVLLAKIFIDRFMKL